MSAAAVSHDTLAVIGAGPVGLEAAALALEAGFDVHVFERGEPGAHVLAWGHVTMFTDWAHTVGPASARLLARHGAEAPAAGDPPTGQELVDRVLAPLAATPELAARVHAHAQVVQVSRRGRLRSDPRDPAARSAHPFRLLVRDAGGRENFLHAHALIDASGVLGAPHALGTGGIAARQELYLAPQMSYQCDDVLGVRRPRHAGKRTLVVGGGAGAATVVVALAQLAAEVPGTTIAWAMRDPQGRLRGEHHDDPLARRAALFAAARSLPSAPDSPLTRHLGCEVESLEYNSATHRYRVHLHGAEGVITEEVDQVVAQCGYGRDRALVCELLRDECPRMGGPRSLSRALEAGGASAPPMTAELLAHPEPGYYEIGARAHGGRSGFLLAQGYAQAAAVVAALAARRDALVGG